MVTLFGQGFDSPRLHISLFSITRSTSFRSIGEVELVLKPFISKHLSDI
jgi:hypothetical protein